MHSGISFSKHSHWPGHRTISGLILLAALLLPRVWGQIPAGEAAAVPLLEPDRPSLSVHLDRRWELDAARSAGRRGLPLAVPLYQRVLGREDWDETTRATLQLELLQVHLAEGNLEAASLLAGALPSLPPALQPEAALLQGIVAFLQGDAAAARARLETVDRSALPPGQWPWLDLVLGLLAEAEGNLPLSIQYLQAARDGAASPSLRTHFENLVLQQKLQADPVDDQTLAQLEGLWRGSREARIGAQYALELAFALQKSGRNAQALEVLQSQLRQIRPEDADLLDRFYLIIGLLSGPEEARRRVSFEWLLANGRDPAVMRGALYWLVREARRPDQTGDLLAYLGGLVNRSVPHPLEDEILLARAEAAQLAKQPEVARESLDRLLAEYPGSALAGEGLRLLAFISWSGGAYRSAADYFLRLRNRLPAGAERALAGIYQGDCYFRNLDYLTAAEAYAAVRPEIADPVLARQVAFQQALALLRAGQLESSETLLDGLTPESGPESLYRWEAEFNLAQALRQAGAVDRAYARIERLLALDDETGSVFSPGLSVRFAWMRAVLTLESGRLSEVAAAVDFTLQLLASVAESEVSSSQSLIIRSNCLLLRGRAGLALAGEDPARVEAAMDIFRRLRQEMPATEAAAYSLFEEARYLIGVGRTVDAQQRYLAVADAYPGSPLAPFALYEAALNASNLLALVNPEALASETSEPLILLRRLTEQYGRDSELFFYARLKQGDLARNLGRFSLAQGIYENLLQQFPEHPQRYLAEISRADAIAAQQTEDPLRATQAIPLYERLSDRPDVPSDLRVEAGFKWGFALQREGNPGRAREIYFIMITRFLHPPGEGVFLGPTGRYWISRVLLELGQSLERDSQPAAARQQYEEIIRQNLPGQALAAASLRRLSEPVSLPELPSS